MNSYQVNRGIREAIAFSAIVDIDGVMNPKTGGFHVVQDAIDDGHKSIFVRDGTYPKFLLNQESVTIVGESWDVHIKAEVSETAIMIEEAYCKIKNLRASTPAGGGQTFHAFANQSNATYCLIEDCACFESDSDGIFQYATQLTIRGGRYTGCDRNGISIITPYATVAGVYSTDNGSDGVYIGNGTGDNSLVTGCVLVDNGQYGVNIAAGDENCVIVGNRVGGNTTGQISDASGTSTVTGNNEN